MPVVGSGSDVGREVLAGEGGTGGDEVGGYAIEDDPTAVAASAGALADTVRRVLSFKLQSTGPRRRVKPRMPT